MPVNNKIVGNKNNSTDQASAKWITLRLSTETVISGARVVITKATTYPTVNEIELYRGGVKISDTITGTASIQFSVNYPGSKAFDGIANTSTASNSNMYIANSGGIASGSPVMLMGKLSSLQVVDAIRLLTGWNDSGSSRQLEDFEIQLTTDPTALVTDSVSSPKWFGVDLLNGKADGTEQAMTAESGGTPIVPSSGFAGTKVFVFTEYQKAPLVDFVEIGIETIPQFEMRPLVDSVEIGIETIPQFEMRPLVDSVELYYEANIDNGISLVIDKFTGGVKAPKVAKYRSKVFEIEGFNPQVTGVQTKWSTSNHDSEIEIRLYIANTLAEVKAATVPSYTAFHPAKDLGENISMTQLEHPLNGRYAQIEFIMRRTQAGDESVSIKEFLLHTTSDEFRASPSVREALMQASTLSYRPWGTAVLTFDTETDNTYYSKLWGLLHRPNGTAIALSTRSANSLEALEAQGWTSIPSGSNSPQVGRFVQLKIEMSTEHGGLTPSIPLFDLSYAQDPDHVHIPSLHKIKTDLIRYVFDAKILNQMNRSNLTSMYVDVFEDESGVEYKNGAMLAPLAEGKGYRTNEGVAYAEVVSLTQVLPIIPSRFIFSTYDKGNVEYDVSFDGGASWIVGVRRDVQINTPLEKAGDELKIRARLLSEGAEISAWGVIF